MDYYAEISQEQGQRPSMVEIGSMGNKYMYVRYNLLAFPKMLTFIYLFRLHNDLVNDVLLRFPFGKCVLQTIVFSSLFLYEAPTFKSPKCYLYHL